VLCVVLTVVISTVIFADDSSTVQTAMSTAVNGMKTDIMAIVMLVVPVALAITGSIIAIKKGISVVKGLVGR